MNCPANGSLDKHKGVFMIRNVFLVAFCLFACTAFAQNAPTPADASVLVNEQATAQSAKPACGSACCETAKEVRLGPWQARRLVRQAERQEVRDCRNCCKCNDCCKDDCKPTAIVVTRTRTRCNCCN